MSNVILTIHLILALVLIGIVLMQRSEGGGLGIGGGGGGVMSGRSAATALGKVTWLVAIAFLTTSLTMTIITARQQAGDSVIERAGGQAPAADESTIDGQSLLPPTLPDSPSTPPKAE